MATTDPTAQKNGFRPYMAVKVRSLHPKLYFRGIGYYKESGGGLTRLRVRPADEQPLTDIEQLDEEDEHPALEHQSRSFISWPNDDTPIEFYMGHPDSNTDARGTFALKIVEKHRDEALDADTYVSLTYNIPEDGSDIQYHVTVVETELHVDPVRYYTQLKEPYENNWRHKMIASNDITRRKHKNTSIPFLIEARMTQNELCGNLEITMRDDEDHSDMYTTDVYFIAAPLPDLSQHLLRSDEHTSLSTDLNLPIWDVRDPEESILMNFIVRHPDIVLRNPQYFIMFGVVGDGPTERVDINTPGTSYFMSTNEAKSCGAIVYEILSRTNDQNPAYSCGRRDRPYLVLAWDVNPGRRPSTTPAETSEEPDDERYVYAAVILHSDSPAFPGRAYSQRRLFEKLTKLILDRKSHEWLYKLPDGEQFGLKLRVSPLRRHIDQLPDDELLQGIESAAIKYADQFHHDVTADGAYLEPGVLDVLIEQLPPISDAEVDRVFHSSSLYAPASGYYWESFDALLKINERLSMLATWDPHEIYMLIDFPGWELPGQTGPIIEARRELSNVFFERMQVPMHLTRDNLSVAGVHLRPENYNLFECRLPDFSQAFRMVYVIHDSSTYRRFQVRRQYLVFMCDLAQNNATVVHESVRLGTPAPNGHDIIEFLQRTNVEGKSVAGDMIESFHPVLENTVLRLKQYQSFGQPNVATCIIREDFDRNRTLTVENKLQVTIIKNYPSLKFSYAYAQSLGWRDVTGKGEPFHSLDNTLQEWKFEGLVVKQGENRAVSIHLGIQNPGRVGDLSMIDIDVCSFHISNGAHDHTAICRLVGKPDIFDEEIKTLNTFTSDELYARDDRDDTLTRRNYSVVTTYLRNLEMCYAVFYLGVSRTDNCVHAILAIHSAHPAAIQLLDETLERLGLETRHTSSNDH